MHPNVVVRPQGWTSPRRRRPSTVLQAYFLLSRFLVVFKEVTHVGDGGSETVPDGQIGPCAGQLQHHVAAASVAPGPHAAGNFAARAAKDTRKPEPVKSPVAGK